MFTFFRTYDRIRRVQYTDIPYQGIGELFSGPYKSWSVGPETHDSALSLVRDIIASDGPFDACVGFSQGAVLLSTLILAHQREHPFKPDLFKIAIFFSGACPFEVNDGKWVTVDPTAMKTGKIRIPTTHIYGVKDDIIGQCSKLVECCDPDERTVFKHGFGHEIPRRPVMVVEEMAKAVEKSITRARFQM